MKNINKPMKIKDHSVMGGLVFPIISPLRAVFVGAYSKAVEHLNNKSDKSESVEGKAHRERPVPFYNWLEERDSLPQSIVQSEPSLENWLEW